MKGAATRPLNISDQAAPLTDFCFIHAADLHLDTPFEGVGRSAPAVQTALRESSLEAWDALVELALTRQAAFVVIAGDLYDGATRGLRAQLRVLRGLRQLSEAGIATFIVHGNHDPLDGWSAIDEWPELVTVCGHRQVEPFIVERDGAPIATLHGISYATREQRDNLALRYQRPTSGGLHVGVLHANVGGDTANHPYSPCTIADLTATGMDYWALGHLHQHQILSRDPWIVYSGALQGRSAKASERGVKGAVLVDVVDDRVTRASLVPLDRVRFVLTDVDVSELPDVPAVRDALAEVGARALRDNVGRSVLLRARLRGRGRVSRDLHGPGHLDDLLTDLRAEYGLQTPFLWWDSLRDESARQLDREAILAHDGFGASLIRHAAAINPESDEYVSGVAHQLSAGRYGRLLTPIDEASAIALLGEAEQRALELLEDEG